MKPRLSRTSTYARSQSFSLSRCRARRALASAARVGILSNKYATENGRRLQRPAFRATRSRRRYELGDSHAGFADQRLRRAARFRGLDVRQRAARGQPRRPPFADTGRRSCWRLLRAGPHRRPSSVSPHGGARSSSSTPTPPTAPARRTRRDARRQSMLTHPLTSGITRSPAEVRGRQQREAGHDRGREAGPSPMREARPTRPSRFASPKFACVIQVAMAPNYNVLGVAGTDFGGDFPPRVEERIRLRRQALHARLTWRTRAAIPPTCPRCRNGGSS
jgi:hypothetical protein